MIFNNAMISSFFFVWLLIETSAHGTHYEQSKTLKDEEDDFKRRMTTTSTSKVGSTAVAIPGELKSFVNGSASVYSNLLNFAPPTKVGSSSAEEARKTMKQRHRALEEPSGDGEDYDHDHYHEEDNDGNNWYHPMPSPQTSHNTRPSPSGRGGGQGVELVEGICTIAQEMELSEKSVVSQTGSTNDGDTFKNLEACYYGYVYFLDPSKIESPVAAYSITGNGEFLSATVMGPNDWTYRVAVYESDCESFMQCVVHEYQDYDQTVWSSTMSTTYYVVVYGVGSSGEYVLQLEVLSSGDICEDAVAVEVTSGDSELILTGDISDPETGFIFDVLGSCRARSGSDNHNDDYYDDHWGVIMPPLSSSSDEAHNHDEFYIKDEPGSNNNQYYMDDHIKDEPGSNNNQYYMDEDADYHDRPSRDSQITSPAAIYIIEGTGETMTASLYGTGYIYDSNFHFELLQGSCAAPECVYQSVLRDDQTLTWLSSVDMTYFLAVHGCCGPTATGDFVMGIRALETGDVCQHAIPLGDISSGVALTGSTKDALYYWNHADCTENNEAFQDQNYWYYANVAENLTVPAMVYAVDGTGDSILASVSTSGCCDDYQLMAYAGLPCDPDSALGFQVQCLMIDMSFVRSSLVWPTEVGITYYIFVYPSNPDYYYGSSTESQFLLRVETAPSGQVCKDAEPLASPVAGESIVVTGSTEDGALYTETLERLREGSYLCDGYRGDYSFQAPASVYNVTGTGDTWIVSIAHDFDPFYYYDGELYMTVLRGDCENLECLDRLQNDFYNDGMRISFESELDQDYFIFIYKCCEATSTADFELTITALAEGEPCDAEVLGPIPADGLEVEGSTISSGFVYSNLQDCYIYYRDTYQSLGTMYAVIGTGETMSASVQSIGDYYFDVQVEVYGGSCSNLLCLGRDSSYGSRSTSWLSVGDEVYYILVHGCCSVSEAGSYRLSVSSFKTGDICEDSIALGDVTEDGVGVTASTKTSGSYFYDLERCYYDTIESPAMIYKVDGTGNRFSASVHSEDFYATLAVYEGGCESTLTCVPQYSYRYASNEVSWTTVEGQEYHILVFGCCDSSSVGDFTLTISSLITSSPCDISKPLTIDDSMNVEVSGSTRNGSYLDVSSCQEERQYSPGAIYSLEGTGDVFRATTVSTGYYFYPTMEVLEGSSCDETLRCVDGDLKLGQTAVWDSQVGTTYFIHIFGCCTQSDVGDFTLTVDTIKQGDFCEVDDVKALDAVPENSKIQEEVSMYGSDVRFFSDLTSCQYYENFDSMGIAFSLIGNGDVYSVSLNQCSWSLNIVVYTGECGGLSCVTGLDDNDYGGYNELSWETRENTLYYVLVYASSMESTYTDCSMTIESRKVGVACENTIDLGEIPEEGIFRFDSTDDGLYYPSLDNCYNSVSSPAVVYKIEGTGDAFYAMTLDNGFSMRGHVAVYEGDCGGDFYCVGINDYNGVQWQTTSGTTYYIVVFGCCYDHSLTGDFLLKVEKIETTKDFCDGTLSLGEISDTDLIIKSGSTDDGKFFEVDLCFDGEEYYYIDEISQSKGVVYSFIGDGNRTLVTTQYGSDYSTYVEIYSGRCNSLECVDRSSFYYKTSVAFESVEGEEYFALVYSCCGGYSTSSDYILMIEPMPTGDLCADAVEAVLSETGSFMASGTAGLWYNVQTCDMYDDYYDNVYSVGISSPASVFKVIGTGDNLIASVRNLDGGYSAYVSVYEGSCESPSCTEEVHYESSIQWLSVSGQEYWVFVHGCCEATTVVDFELTIEVVPVGNACEAAELEITADGGAVEFGSLADAKVFYLEECGYYSYYETEGLLTGVMYSLVAGSDEFIIANVTSFSYSEDIEVYKGNCEGLVCVSPYTDYENTVMWQAVAGTTYYVLIRDIYHNPAPVDEYRLEISKIPLGDVCSDSIAAGELTPAGLVYSGSIATKGSMFVDLEYCYNEFPYAGIIYSVAGTGGRITASLESQDDPYERFFTVNVYSGGCDSLECVDYIGSYPYNTFTWASEADQTYYVFVTTYSVGYNFDFTLHLYEIPRGEPCEDAISLGGINISKSVHVDGSTEPGSGKYYSFSPCSDYYYDSYYYNNFVAAKLYSVAGTSEVFTASVSGDWDFYPTIFLYQGSCESELKCVEGTGEEEQYYDISNNVIWQTELGETYWLLIGSDYNTGNFTLNVTAVVTGDACIDTVNLGKITEEGLDYEVSGSGDYWYMDYCNGYYYYMDQSGQGMMYSIIGDGDILSASVISSYSRYPALVYTGECDALQCINDTSYGQDLIWLSEPNVEYYIFVPAAVDTTLRINKFSSGDVCADAIRIDDIEEDGELLVGSTGGGGIFLGGDACGYISSSPTVLYSIIGEGNAISVTIFQSQYFLNLGISVYEGVCSEDLSCVSYEAYDGVSFVADEGKTYYISVREGYDSTVSADFELYIESIPVGSICDDTMFIDEVPEGGTALQSGSTREGKFHDTFNCGWYGSVRASIFSIESSSVQRLTVSILPEANFFPQSIVIKSTDCEDFECVYTDGYDNQHSFTSDPDTRYNIMVFSDFDVGDFVVQVDSRNVASTCDDMVEVTMPPTGGMSMTGSTSTANFHEELPYCWGNIESSSTVYSVEGNGKPYQASVYSDNFNPSLALLEGSCDDASCAYNMNHWGSGVSWESEMGKKYMVVVYGCCEPSAVGEYVLQLNQELTQPLTPTGSPSYTTRPVGFTPPPVGLTSPPTMPTPQPTDTLSLTPTYNPSASPSTKPTPQLPDGLSGRLIEFLRTIYDTLFGWLRI